MARLASLGLLLLLLLTASQVSGTSYQDYEEDDKLSNEIPVIANDKRASNLGTRLDNRFNLGKKFVGYRWIRSMESRQRRTPYLSTPYRLVVHPHNQDYSRDNNVHWVRRY